MSGDTYFGTDAKLFRDLKEYQKQLDDFKENSTCEDREDKQKTIKELKDKIILFKDQLRINSRTFLLNSLLNPENIYEELQNKKLIHSLPITQEELSLFSDARRPSREFILN